MIWKILAILLGIWLFFKLFGKRIFLYLLKKMVQKLEQQTLKDMKHFQNLYDEKVRQSYHLNDEFSIIIPDEKFQSGKKRHTKVIEEVEFEEVKKDEKQ